MNGTGLFCTIHLREQADPVKKTDYLFFRSMRTTR